MFTFCGDVSKRFRQILSMFALDLSVIKYKDFRTTPLSLFERYVPFSRSYIDKNINLRSIWKESIDYFQIFKSFTFCVGRYKKEWADTYLQSSL